MTMIGTDKIQLHLSVAMVLEYEEILRREVSSILTPDEMDHILDYLCASGVHYDIPFLWRPALQDPDDDFVLELAVAAGVEYIVSFSQRDFRPASQFGISAIKPGEFLTLLEKST